MKIRVLAVFVLLISANFLQGQNIADKGSYKKNMTEGNLLRLEENYMTALEYYTFAYHYDSTNANINYCMGLCYLYHPTKKHEAEKYLEKAVKDVTKNYMEDEPAEKRAPALAYFYLAKAYHLDGRLDDAGKMFDMYEAYLKKGDKKGHEDVARFKTMLKYAKQYMKNPKDVKIENMGDSINDAFPDYSPLISADERTLIFTHRGKGNVGGGELAPDGYPYEDVMVSVRRDDGHWSTPSSISPYVNTSGHDGAVGLTPDGQTLIVYRDDLGDGNLYYSTWDGRDWSMPLKYGSNINSKYWEPSACLSRDGNTLYFVSDRPDGFGGRDIYRCVKLPNGQWSLAQNLGPNINTPYDEESPFMSADGVTFYFSSQGHATMGGFDIMFSILGEDGQFSTPINMEYPINSTDDDLYLVASPDNKRLYYASAHEDLKAFGEKDIYKITYEGARSNSLALFKGQIKPGPCDSLPDDIVIVVTNKETGELVGNFRPQHKTGTFAVIIPPGSKYTFTYQQGGVDILSEDVFVSNDISYEEIDKGVNLKPHNLCNGGLYDQNGNSIDLSLNITVLNNKTEKKPVAGAKVSLHTKEGNVYEGKTDDSGKISGLKLEREMNYDIVAVDHGKKSISDAFNTIGIKENKVYEKVLYMEKTAEEASFKIQLNVTVLNNKAQRKPVKNATVKLTGTDGSVYEGTTDAKGKLKGIALSPETNYELTASFDGNNSAKNLVMVTGIRKSKTFEKVVFVSGAAETQEIPDNSEVTGTKFKFYFKYNMNEVDESAPEYTEFINNLAEAAKSGVVKLKITASASQVPTLVYKTNQELAETRLKRTEEKLKSSLKSKGLSEGQVTIVKEKAIVGGPTYNADAAQKKEVYEKYQYVSIEAF